MFPTTSKARHQPQALVASAIMTSVKIIMNAEDLAVILGEQNALVPPIEKIYGRFIMSGGTASLEADVSDQLAIQIAQEDAAVELLEKRRKCRLLEEDEKAAEQMKKAKIDL
ncbi:hypothetical protein HDU87_008433 [Geranomyces variabilis]|uniref:Uncharacterized protein n=1 Tax=Geranomyces variabilis TaxID=109894 RepID=A0AAD5TD52_9FUNG|nr:hypothetical protein HDU87_008433 [Geranomyces variabilis]